MDTDERCPDCGYPVPSIWAHLEGCPPGNDNPPAKTIVTGRIEHGRIVEMGFHA